MFIELQIKVSEQNMRTYKYKGFEFALVSYADLIGHQVSYEIKDLKPAPKSPFLGTINECKKYIDQHIRNCTIKR